MTMLNKLMSDSNRAILLGFMTIFFFFGGLGSWVVFANLDSAVVGPGDLIVSGNRKSIQHKEGGTITRVNVIDGDFVEAGSVLLQLDDHDYRATLNAFQSSYNAAKISLARATAELAGATNFEISPDLEFTAEVHEVYEKELNIFNNHREFLAKQLEIQDFQIAQAQFQMEALKSQLAAVNKESTLVEEQLDTLKSLYSKGLETNQRLLDLTRISQQLNGNAAQIVGEIGRSSTQISQAGSEKVRLRVYALESVTKESRDTELKLQDLQLKIGALKYTIENLTIKAPISGSIVNLKVSSLGGTVQPGQVIMEIVPNKIPIVVDAKIRPEDIDHIVLGNLADIRVNGQSSHRSLPIKGRVTRRSADRVVDARTGYSYFSVEIELVDDLQDGKLMQRLVPGMTVDVVIPVKSRVVLDYLLSPLLDSIRKVGREV